MGVSWGISEAAALPLPLLSVANVLSPAPVVVAPLPFEAIMMCEVLFEVDLFQKLTCCCELSRENSWAQEKTRGQDGKRAWSESFVENRKTH
jgi:hypothetical protein